MKLFRIPIKVEPQFFVLTIFLGFSRARDLTLLFEWVLVVLFSVLVHEFGHALVARAFGLEPRIRLYQMGGLTSWAAAEKELSQLRHLAISLAGPAFGFLIGAIVLLLGQSGLAGQSQLAFTIYSDLLWVNIGWSLFNLLPILPMDGGQVLVTLESWIRKRNDRLISHLISLLAALAIAVIALNWRALWIGFLAVYFAYLNGSPLFRRWQSHRDRRLSKSLEEAAAAINRNELETAMAVLSRVTAQAKSNELKRDALRMTIVVHLRQGKLEPAETELRRCEALFGRDYYLQGALHFLKGEMTEALPNLQTIFETQPEEQIGIMLCKTLLGTGDFAAALRLSRHPALAAVRWGLTAEIQSEAFNRGEYSFSATAGALAYEQKPDAGIAYNVACAFARDSNLSAALRWAKLAISAGFSDADALRSDPDLDAIRSLPEFAAMLRNFEARTT